MRAAYAVFLIFAVLFSATVSAEEWYTSYEKGKEKAEKNQCDDAEKLLLLAISKNPNSDNRARPYGTITMEYLPHYFLARCAFQKQNWQDAKKYLDQAQTFGIEKSSKAEEYRVLKNRVMAKLAAPATDQQ